MSKLLVSRLITLGPIESATYPLFKEFRLYIAHAVAGFGS